MLNQYLKQIVAANPDLAAITPVIEKEILHHDIMAVLVQQGVMSSLTFIGGTALRMCYNSSRLSEDLDFNGGHNFKPADFNGLEHEIKSYIEAKYETNVWVNKPSSERQGDTSSWTISIEKEANRPDLTRQKMHIDVCAIPSFDIEKRPLINHYNIAVPTEGLLIPVQSLDEIMADKFIALAYRARRIKPRDIWDVLWLSQRNVEASVELTKRKLDARGKAFSDFSDALMSQVTKLQSSDETRDDFYQEMRRFIPTNIQVRTLKNPDYWNYVQAETKKLANKLLASETPHQFDMGNS